MVYKLHCIYSDFMGRMAQTNVNIRMDTKIKQEAEKLFESLSLNMSTAFNIFIRQSLRTGSIPFEITTRDDGFFNQYNQMKLRMAARRMDKGKGVVHEMTESENRSP